MEETCLREDRLSQSFLVPVNATQGTAVGAI
jgi:hypothetical protein